MIKENNKKELDKLLVELTEEAISVKLDYENTASNLDSGSVIHVQQNSPLLDDENETLSDVVVNIKRKENE